MNYFKVGETVEVLSEPKGLDLGTEMQGRVAPVVSIDRNNNYEVYDEDAGHTWWFYSEQLRLVVEKEEK